MISTGIKFPQIIQRALTQTLLFPVYSAGALITPASGTITIYDASQTKIIDAASVTITSGVATYSLSSSDIPITLSLSSDWLIEWSLTINGTVETLRQQACLVLRKLFPVVSDPDISARHYEILSLVSPYKAISVYTDEAWNVIQARLFSLNRFPYLIISSWSLREPHLFLALHLIYKDLETMSAGKGKYGDLADFYLNAFDKSWNSLTYVYDEGETNNPSVPQISGQPVIYLNATSRWGYGNSSGCC